MVLIRRRAGRVEFGRIDHWAWVAKYPFESDFEVDSRRPAWSRLGADRGYQVAQTGGLAGGIGPPDLVHFGWGWDPNRANGAPRADARIE